MTAFFKNDSFPFAVENALGEGYHQTTDTGGPRRSRNRGVSRVAIELGNGRPVTVGLRGLSWGWPTC